MQLGPYALTGGELHARALAGGAQLVALALACSGLDGGMGLSPDCSELSL